ncbi:MAG: hypothetical protein OEY91_01175 [Nitrospirota bacterium]|nr:hypothetical protein [Nitrospirota bacterium]
MKRSSLHSPFRSYWFPLACLMWAFAAPINAAETIDGFRDLKFGMTPEEVQALPACQTSHECLFELSNKNRYVHLTYAPDHTASGSDSAASSRLAQINIDMGQYTDGWHQQLQMILGKSYQLTHDFTDETMNAFLAKQLEELRAGYENGQVILTVARRPFGNMILKVIYQNTTLAEEFIQQPQTPRTTTP